MDSCSSCKLCQTTDGFLYLARGYHHQISKLIHNNHDLRHLLRSLRITPYNHIFDFLVISFEITDIKVCKLLITIRHLGNAPLQGSRCFLRISHNRNHQMWNSIINT